MDERKRTIQIKFRVTETERDLILEKMELIPTLWICCAIELRFWGIRYKSLARRNPRPQSRVNQGFYCPYCVTGGREKAAFLFSRIGI